MKLKPGDPDYPLSLYCLDQPPALRVSGPLTAPRVIAIVGSRSANDDACDFAFSLAYHLARAGVVVVSGGAFGVDRAAHEGAFRGGATWLVSPTGRDHVYPPENLELVERLTASRSSRVIWPFDDDTSMTKMTPRFRNGVLVGLAEAVIVLQAAERSGSRNAASWSRYLGRDLFIAPGPPWDPAHLGSVALILEGARPLWSVPTFFQDLGLRPPDMKDPQAARGDTLPPSPRLRRKRIRPQTYTDPPRFAVDPTTWSEDKKLVFSKLSGAPTQQDAIIVRTGLSASATITALLTLSLKDVVVEGPDGFFRCRLAL